MIANNTQQFALPKVTINLKCLQQIVNKINNEFWKESDAV